MIVGLPGRSRISPPVYVVMSPTGGMRSPPCRAEYQRKPTTALGFMGPHPLFWF